MEGSVWAVPEDQKLLPTGRLDGNHSEQGAVDETRHSTLLVHQNGAG